jgi:hypothetical protein
MTSADRPDRESSDTQRAIELPPLPELPTWATKWGVAIANEVMAYATAHARAAVLADREKRARFHIQDDGPFTRADVEALCELAVAAYKKALEIQSGTKLP